MQKLKKFIGLGPLLILLAAFLWAVDGVLRRSLYSLSPLIIVFYEHLIGLILLLPVFAKFRSYFRKFTWMELANLALIALFSGLLGTLLFTTALLKVNYIPFSVVFLLQKLQPVFVMVAAALILKEKITRQYMQFAVVAIIAAYFVTFPNGMVNLQTGQGTIIAALYSLGAAFLWGTSTIFSKIALRTKPDEVVTAMRFGLTTAFGLVAIIFFGQAMLLPQIDLSQIFRFFLIAISTGMFALYIYYKGLAKTEAKVATILELVFPVTAVFIDMFVYKTLLQPMQYLAAGILLFAAYRLSQLRSEKHVISSQKITGKGRGKKLGFPTINLEIPAKFSLRDGIYAVYVTLDGKKYQGALHYGPIPTFDDGQKSLEVFLINVKDLPNSSVTGKSIHIEFIQYVRPVMKFTNNDALVDQIALDVRTISGML